MTRRLATVACVAALVAGCATPPDHFHTLRPSAAGAARAARTPGRTLAIGPVTVPDALARDAWVIRVGETGVHDDCLRVDVIYRREDTIIGRLLPSESVSVRLTLATLGDTLYSD